VTSPRRYLHLRMGVGRGLSLRIVERPGLALKPDALAGLVEELKSVARAVLPDGDLEYGVLGGDRERLDNTVVTVIYEKGQPVAFNALALMDATVAGRPVEVLHLGLVMVDPALRGRGLSEMLYGLTCVLIFLRRQCRPVRLSNVTQVPAVVGMVSETFDQVFPTPDRTTGPSFAHRTLARQIMARHRHVFGVGPEAMFDEERSVILDSYTGGSDDLKKTFEAAPKHRKAPYNEMCRIGLDYDRGDDFLQIGQLNMEAAGRYLTRVAGPLSGLQFAGRLALFAVQSALLPAVHWFDAREPMGRLRPFRT
jgi:GNAT superfamily N-acetyltransferase